jgi:hypothetical protein
LESGLNSQSIFPAAISFAVYSLAVVVRSVSAMRAALHHMGLLSIYYIEKKELIYYRILYLIVYLIFWILTVVGFRPCWRNGKGHQEKSRWPSRYRSRNKRGNDTCFYNGFPKIKKVLVNLFDLPAPFIVEKLISLSNF